MKSFWGKGYSGVLCKFLNRESITGLVKPDSCRTILRHTFVSDQRLEKI